MVEIKGLGLGLDALGWEMPATTGSIKYGPKRFSYSVLLRRWVNVSGVISRSSFMRYMLTRKRSCSLLGISEPGDGVGDEKECGTGLMSRERTNKGVKEAHVQSVHVRRKARQSVVERVVDGKDFLEVHGNARRLRAEAEVARDRDAVLAEHGNDRAAVVLHNRLV